MALFNKSNVKSEDNENLYENKIKQYVKPNDGRKHVLMITSSGKFSDLGFDIDKKFTLQLNAVVEGLQTDGYEVADIKIISIDEGFPNDSAHFEILIEYK